MARRDQIIKIKIAQKQLNVEEERFDHYQKYGKASATELSETEADDLLDYYKQAGFKEKPRKKLKYSEFDNRDGFRANGAQMRKVEVMWMKNARYKNENAMNSFIRKMTKKSHITFITKKDVEKLIEAIKNFN